MNEVLIMDDNAYRDEIFQILYIWGERSLDQLQKYSKDDFFNILTKLDYYINLGFIHVSKNDNSPESPIYHVLKDEIPHKVKNEVEKNIEKSIKNELYEISSIYPTNIKKAFRSLSYLEEKWNLFKVSEIQGYYIELKQKINSKIKEEIKF